MGQSLNLKKTYVGDKWLKTVANSTALQWLQHLHIDDNSTPSFVQHYASAQLQARGDEPLPCLLTVNGKPIAALLKEHAPKAYAELQRRKQVLGSDPQR